MLGLRIGETLALTYADISKTGKVHINKTLKKVKDGKAYLDTTKNKQTRFLTLPDELSHLLALRGSEDIIISNDKGYYYHYNTLMKEFTTLQLQSISKYYTPHCFRHAAAVRWLSHHEIEIVSRRLGHDSIDMTMKNYSHFRHFNDRVEGLSCSSNV